MLRALIKRVFYADLDCYILFRGRCDSFQNPKLFEDEYSIGLVESLHETIYEKLIEFYLQAKPELNSDTHRKIIQNRFADGSICAVSEKGGEIAGVAWLCSLATQQFADFAACLKQEPNAFLCYDAFVLPRHRGHQLQKRMHLYRKNYALSKGCAVIYTFVGCRNFSSIKNSMAHNDEYKIIYHVLFKLGKSVKYNWYPKWQREPWRSCSG